MRMKEFKQLIHFIALRRRYKSILFELQELKDETLII